jgi:hypothetical protein
LIRKIDENRVVEDLRHALLQQRITAGLADNQVSPLHNDDRDEEGCVACVFKNFALLVSLFYLFFLFVKRGL